MIKLSTEILSAALYISTNNSLNNGVFPDDAKLVSVFSIDKGQQNKNKISNFRTVNILNTYSIIYEKVIKGQLV